jgi:glyoxylase I family protein
MRIHHLALRTRDLARLATFYVDLLGLRILKNDAGRSVWLDAEGAIVMLERAGEGEPVVPEGGLELVAFAIEPGSRGRFEAELAARGILIEARTAFTLYVRDPDGRRVGLSHYPDATPPA